MVVGAGSVVFFGASVVVLVVVDAVVVVDDVVVTGISVGGAGSSVVVVGGSAGCGGFVSISVYLQVTLALSSHFWVFMSNIVAPVQRNFRSSTCCLTNPGEQ